MYLYLQIDEARNTSEPIDPNDVFFFILMTINLVKNNGFFFICEVCQENDKDLGGLGWLKYKEMFL